MTTMSNLDRISQILKDKELQELQKEITELKEKIEQLRRMIRRVYVELVSISEEDKETGPQSFWGKPVDIIPDNEGKIITVRVDENDGGFWPMTPYEIMNSKLCFDHLFGTLMMAELSHSLFLTEIHLNREKNLAYFSFSLEFRDSDEERVCFSGTIGGATGAAYSLEDCENFFGISEAELISRCHEDIGFVGFDDGHFYYQIRDSEITRAHVELETMAEAYRTSGHDTFHFEVTDFSVSFDLIKKKCHHL